MIEVDNFWYQKTFEAVLADLWRRCDEEIHEQENETLHCTEMTKPIDIRTSFDMIYIKTQVFRLLRYYSPALQEY